MKQNGLGIASLILGIIGLLSACVIIGIVPSIIALILGAVALCQKDRKSKGCAMAGIICSIIGIVIFVLFLAFLSLNTKETEASSAETVPETVIEEVVEAEPTPEQTEESVPEVVEEESVSEQPKLYEGDILFNNIQWGTKYAEVEKALPKLNLMPIYGDSYKTMSTDAIAIGDYEGIDFEYTDINVIANSIMSEMEVAGYTTEDVSLYFAYSVEDGAVNKTPEESIFYGAQYTFVPLSLDEMSEDLISKISSIYGEPNRIEEDNDIWGNEYQYIFWVGQNDTELVIRTQDAEEDDEIYDDEIVISYIWRGGDKLLQEASDLLKEEDIKNESAVYGNDSTTGL